MALNKTSKFGADEGLFPEDIEKKDSNTQEVHDVQEVNTTSTTVSATPSEYTVIKEETRSQRLQIVVKPSVNKKLDKLVKQKKIKSKNDLINFLVEDYLERN